jgi:hypothetical protein
MAEGVLRKFGFRKGWIYETVVTTCSKDGVPNSAPMGVWTKDYKTVVMKVYKEHKTFRNLMVNGFFVINFPDNVTVFHDVLSGKKPKYSKTKKCFSISGLSYIELKVIGMREVDNAILFKASIIGHKVRKRVRLFNRAEALALEYLIEKTRPRKNKKLLLDYKRTVSKVAPKSTYAKIVGLK